MANLTFINFKAVRHGAREVGSVRRIVFDVDGDVLTDAGDGQAGPSIVACVGRKVGGRIELEDGQDWLLLMTSPEADLCFVAEAAGAGADRQVTLKNVVFGPTQAQWHDGPAEGRPLAGAFVLSLAARFDPADAAGMGDLLMMEEVV